MCAGVKSTMKGDDEYDLLCTGTTMCSCIQSAPAFTTTSQLSA